MLKKFINKFLRLKRNKLDIIPVSLKLMQFGQFCNFTVIGNSHVDVGFNVQMRSFCNITLYPDCKMIIGNNVFFNNYCSINCLDQIEIGENTLLGEGVKIYDHNHKYEFSNDRLEVARNDFNTAPIKIGKNCWIGSNVTILKGVEIGDNVVVGANNLIYKSIPSNSIVKSNCPCNVIPL